MLKTGAQSQTPISGLHTAVAVDNNDAVMPWFMSFLVGRTTMDWTGHELVNQLLFYHSDGQKVKLKLDRQARLSLNTTAAQALVHARAIEFKCLSRKSDIHSLFRLQLIAWRHQSKCFDAAPQIPPGILKEVPMAVGMLSIASCFHTFCVVFLLVVIDVCFCFSAFCVTLYVYYISGHCHGDHQVI